MQHEFTAVYERDGEWVVAYCPEVVGAKGRVVPRMRRGRALWMRSR